MMVIRLEASAGRSAYQRLGWRRCFACRKRSHRCDAPSCRFTMLLLPGKMHAISASPATATGTMTSLRLRAPEFPAPLPLQAGRRPFSSNAIYLMIWAGH